METGQFLICFGALVEYNNVLGSGSFLASQKNTSGEEDNKNKIYGIIGTFA